MATTRNMLLLVLWLWSLPTTLLGFVWCLFCRPVAARWRDGVVEMQVKWLPMNAAGETFGRLVMYSVPLDGDIYVRIREHEMFHVKQNEHWGPFFLFAYGIACLVAMAQGENFYFDNYFEVEARRANNDY